MEFVFENTVGSSCFTACALASGVAGLDDEVFDDAVEDDVVVVALETELDKGTACLWGFFGEEFNVNGPMDVLTRTRPVGSGSMLYCDDMAKNSDKPKRHKNELKKPHADPG